MSYIDKAVKKIKQTHCDESRIEDELDKLRIKIESGCFDSDPESMSDSQRVFWYIRHGNLKMALAQYITWKGGRYPGQLDSQHYAKMEAKFGKFLKKYYKAMELKNCVGTGLFTM